MTCRARPDPLPEQQRIVAELTPDEADTVLVSGATARFIARRWADAERDRPQSAADHRCMPRIGCMTTATDAFYARYQTLLYCRRAGEFHREKSI
ncbi:hypothetical protein KIF59_18125 [Enterobacter cloacae subsp. cloacae]|nr:hypothetical protein [Enterobacter cloacae subsp. cloacae]